MTYIGGKPLLIAQKISHKCFHMWKCYLECKKWQIKEIHSKCYRLHLHSNKLGGFYSFPPYQTRLVHFKGKLKFARGDICRDRRDRQSQKITKFTFYWEIPTPILHNFVQWRCNVCSYCAFLHLMCNFSFLYKQTNLYIWSNIQQLPWGSLF